MSNLDIEFVRSNFPAFSEASLAGWGFFENAGGSYACWQVIDHLNRYYRQTKVQPYHDFPASTLAGEQMDAAKRRLAAWLNVDTEEVHFGPSTSLNTYMLAQALRQELKCGDEIIVTNQDHEANVGSWNRLENDGIVVRQWKVDPDTAELLPSDLKALLNARTRAVAFPHCSNLVGSINPVREITDMIHQAGAMAIVDGVSFCPHGLPDVKALGADIYLFSLYKVYGPHLGVMVMSKGLNARLPSQGHFFNADIPDARFTPAGPDHAQIASVNGVMDYFEVVYRHHHGDDAPDTRKAAAVMQLFQAQESRILQALLDFLSGHPKVRLIGRNTTQGRAPTVTFTAKGHHPGELASQLAGFKLGVGAGHFYAYRLIKALGIDTKEGALRTSLVHYTHVDEVERLITALDQLL